MASSFEKKFGERTIRIRSSIVWAGIVALVIVVWLASGLLNKTPRREAERMAATEQTAETDSVLTRVRVKTLAAVPHEVELTVRGRTEALRSVHVRAETSGRVVALPVEKGMPVKEGDVLCELSLDARQAQMDEARALMTQRKLEWEAAKQLQKQGHRSETQTAASKAAYESAISVLRRMEVELERTKIRAPYDGVFNDRMVEIGDYMSPGQVCGIVVDQNPWLVVAEVSEQDIVHMRTGGTGTARLVSGEEVSGNIRYLSASANPSTRTFRVELEIDDTENFIFRDGVTADLKFPLGVVPAHHISPAILGLNTRGDVGVRIIDENNVVSFVQVNIVSDMDTGVWVTGLPPVATVITVGQEMVNPGETVDPVEDEQYVQDTMTTAPLSQ